MSITSVKLADLDIIESLDLESGFHGVYPRDSGHWCAKPYAGYNVGSKFPTARHAAIAVVKWWKDNFGPDEWIEIYERRKERPFRVEKIKSGKNKTAWDTLQNKAVQVSFGYRLFVWLVGEETVVPSPIRPLGLFASSQSAKAFLPGWLRSRFGLFADVAMSPIPPIRFAK